MSGDGEPSKSYALSGAAYAVETLNLVELIGIEPTTSGLQSQRSPN
jgi:hypothetical protein